MSNFEYQGKGFYMARTQAGLKKAIKHAVGDDDFRNLAIEGYPESYPCLVHIYIVYRGSRSIVVDALHFNTLRKAMDESDANHIANSEIVNNHFG